MLDDSRARFFRREQSGGLVQAAADVAAGSSRASTPESRRQDRETVLRAAVETVDSACRHNECERLIVVAPERMLAGFRKYATDNVRARLWRERASEVSALSTDDIAKSLEMYFKPGAP